MTPEWTTTWGQVSITQPHSVRMDQFISCSDTGWFASTGMKVCVLENIKMSALSEPEQREVRTTPHLLHMNS